MEGNPKGGEMKTKFGETVAPKGQIWVCHACGKTARDKYGPPNAHPLWDESCALNCALHPEDMLNYDADGNGRVVSFKTLEEL